MDTAVMAAAIAALSPIMVAFFTWITRRGLERRTVEAQNKAAEIKQQTDLLGQQREDFKALIGPLQETVVDLRARVSHLEAAVDKSNRLNTKLIKALEDVLEHLEEHYQDPGPRLDRDIKDLLEGK